MSVCLQWKEWKKAPFPITLGSIQTSVHLTNHLSFSSSSFFQNNQDNQTIQTSKETQTSSPHQMVSWQACPVRTHAKKKSLTYYLRWHTIAHASTHTCTLLYMHTTPTYRPLCVCVCPNRVGSKFIMVRRADGTVLWGLCWDCGGPLINHTDVIGRWEPHGRCRAERWPHVLSPLWLTPDRDGAKERAGEKWRELGGWSGAQMKMRGEENREEKRDGQMEKGMKWREGGRVWIESSLNPRAKGVLYTHTT